MIGCDPKAVLSLLVALTLMTKALPSIPLTGPMNASDWHIETVDSAGDVGTWTSLALDGRGFPHISYRDVTNRDLKFAEWFGTGWQIETIDAIGDVGLFSSIDLDQRGFPHISYHDGGRKDVKYAKWTGTNWSIDFVDQIGNQGDGTSIALDDQDNPHISYGVMSPVYDLKYARWDGTQWLNETIDYNDNVGWFSSIAIDSNDNPHISYDDFTNNDPKYTSWDGSKWNIEIVNGTYVLNSGSGLALDSNDNPHVCFGRFDEHDAMYASKVGGKWITQTVDSADDVGAASSIAVDSQNNPHISYLDLTNDDLKYAYFDGTKWQIETVDSYAMVGWYTDIAIDGDGNPHISYYNWTSGDLKYATKAKLGADRPPVAKAGPDQSVDVGVIVQFDGSGSYDPDSSWDNMTVDSAGDTGGHVSLALDKNGLPHISYFDLTNRYLKYATWDGIQWTDQVIDLAGHVYPHTSISLDSSGYPHISYNGGDILKYARWDGTQWINETVDSSGIVGRYGSIALDSSNLPHISYHDWTNKDLKYAHWNGSAWNIEVVESVGSVGSFPSIALDSNGFPHISYYDHSHGDLKYAHWEGSAWINETVDSEKSVGKATSLALDSSDRPIISYQYNSDRDLRLAKWEGSSWFIETVDRFGDLASATSLTLDGNDYPYISYNDYSKGDLKLARWDGTGWWIHTVETEGAVGGSSSVAVDVNDSPHISYYDKTNGNLDYVREGGAGLTYDWDFGDSSPHGSGANPTHVYTFPGAFLVTLTVTDSSGATASDNCVITAIDRNLPPVADGNGPYFVDEGTPLDLDGSGSSDPDNDTLNYRWDLDNDGAWDTNWSPDPINRHTWLDDGTYTVVLQVRDTHNETDTDSTSVIVLDVSPTAGFTWSPEPQDEGSPVQFTDESTSYPDGIVSWIWEFGDGGSSSSQDPAHTYSDNGIYDVNLTVEDDDGSVDSVSHEITIRNVAPVADAGNDKEGYEASTFTFNGSFYDPGAGDTHTFEWDFDYDGITFDVEAIGQSATHTWTDDFDGLIALRVTDDDGGSDIDTAHVLVKNVPPTVTLEVLPIEVDAFLRIAGEKWHEVSIELFEDGVLIANGTLVRYPGSPDDQMLDLSGLQFDHSKKYTATVTYTPDDDPINGQPNGANPCWIILNFSDGQELWIHHTFNVQHPDTYVWEVDLTAAILSHGMTFEATAFDPGADELIFNWDFGDGTNATNFFSNWNGTYPVHITEIINHVFPSSGTYVVVLTVEDDDGGVGTASLTIVIP